MATITLPETESQNKNKTTAKYVYFFGGGKADGHGKMKDELGGKGAGLAEMTNAGLPVPPIHDSDPGLPRIHVRRTLSGSRQADERGSGEAGAVAGAEIRDGRESAAGERAVGREVFHAGHDGHDFESWLER